MMLPRPSHLPMYLSARPSGWEFRWNTALWLAIAFGICLPRVAGERSRWAFFPVATAVPNWSNQAPFVSMQIQPTCCSMSKILVSTETTPASIGAELVLTNGLDAGSAAFDVG